MFYLGVGLVIWGALGAWHFLADKTGFPILNEMTKDQVTVAFGMLIIFLENRKRRQREK